MIPHCEEKVSEQLQFFEVIIYAVACMYKEG